MIPLSLQALISGWNDANPQWRGTVTDAFCECACTLTRTLELHPVVPLDELKTAVRDGSVFELIDRYTPRQPNPHPPGTYLWAREEHARGCRVRRASLADVAQQVRSAGARLANDPYGVGWDECSFKHGDFIATDWEVVP